MQMNGGGCWGLAPGQLTDDSELAMCQMRGLIDGKGTLNTACIAGYYGKWCQEGPFDIGMTTRNALTTINTKNPSAKAPREAAVAFSNSLSNGSLMKVTPLAVWA